MRFLIVLCALSIVFCGKKNLPGKNTDESVTEDVQSPDVSDDSGQTNVTSTPEVVPPPVSDVPTENVSPTVPNEEQPSVGPTGDTGSSEEGVDGKEEEEEPEVVDGNFVCKKGKTLMCHYPLDNPSNEHEICVSKNSLLDHESDGDTKGECNEN